jgi:hypothetical protein
LANAYTLALVVAERHVAQRRLPETLAISELKESHRQKLTPVAQAFTTVSEISHASITELIYLVEGRG